MTQSDETLEGIEQTQETIEVPHKAADGDLASARQLAAGLISELQKLPDGDLVGEIVETAMKLLRDQSNRGDIKLINRSMKASMKGLEYWIPLKLTSSRTSTGSVSGCGKTNPSNQ
jgi:hypothetical protein